MRFKVKRTFLDDPTQLPFSVNGASEGATQRGEDGAWYVDIADLPQLMAFALQHGELILGTDGTDSYIEIYDADREGETSDGTPK